MGTVWDAVFSRILEVSGLSPYDRATISASFYYYWDDRLNCEKAIKNALKRNPNANVEALRVRFGCKTASDKPRVTIDGINYHSCLCNYRHPLFYSIIELSEKIDNGILPDRGPYLDQSAWMLDALNLIAKHKAEVQAAEHEKQRKLADKKHGR